MTDDRPCILLVDDEARQRDLLQAYLESHGFVVRQAASGSAAIEILGEHPVAMLISDIRMPGMTGLELIARIRPEHPTLPILLITAYADIRTAVNAMRDGAANFLEKPIDLDELLDSIRHALGLQPEPEADAADADMPELPADIVVGSPAMRDLIREAALVAPSDARILITGENGTGKEVIADLVHRWSARAAKPFQKINCAAIPENLLESELFGHEKGAFSGATSKRDGLFRGSDGGTIFLDEIGEMPVALQPKLLRVIQDGTFRPLGSDVEITCDVRVLAATNRDLEVEVEAGRFREDLFFRLNTFEFFVPPLRERREDIVPLAEHFAASLSPDRKRFAAAVAALLNAYDWPGNVRELRNAVERALLMAAGGSTILPEHLPNRIRKYAAPPTVATADATTTPIEDMERLAILQTLERNGFNRSQTARDLGLSRRALTYKIRRLREAGFPVDPK